jgi:hypothetical protein
MWTVKYTDCRSVCIWGFFVYVILRWVGMAILIDPYAALLDDKPHSPFLSLHTKMTGKTRRVIFKNSFLSLRTKMTGKLYFSKCTIVLFVFLYLCSLFVYVSAIVYHTHISYTYTLPVFLPAVNSKKTGQALICFGSFTTHFGGILLF